MAGILDPISPSVSPTIHPQENPKDVSQWFKTETLEINFGETTGRPSPDITFKQEYLAQFLQTGWSIDAVLSQSEGGSWVQVGGGTSVSKSQTFTPMTMNSGLYPATNSGLETELYSQTQGIGAINQIYNGGADVPSTAPVTVSMNTTSPSNDAPAYWAAYQRIRLKRRRLVAENVMQSMMDSFTTAYNNGRSIEDGRYNEIVAIYKLMLSRSEDEGNAIVTSAADLMPVANRLLETVMASVTEADESTAEVGRTSVENRIRDVNRQFDDLIATTKASMITNGMYNTTVWPSTLAGIERQRSEALDKATEAGTMVKFNAKQSVSTLKSTVGAQILTSMQTIASASDQRKITVVELRNTVLKWMLDYIGTREESYPELEEIATVAQRMGFSVGSAGSVL